MKKRTKSVKVALILCRRREGSKRTPKTLGCGYPNKKSQCLQGKIFCKLQWTKLDFEKAFKKAFSSKSDNDEERPFELIPHEVRLVSDELFAYDIRLEALAQRHKNTHITWRSCNECRKFEARNRQRLPNRRYVALVNDSNGKRILSCRYLPPIKPSYHVQKILTNSDNMIEAINLTAHIVSCIPFVADPIMFPGVVDLWINTEQLLTIGCGDEEEHAILLACWFLSLRLSAALILGQALPEGSDAAYVLVQVDQSTPLHVNLSDGTVYSINDPLCPLISVGTIVTQENVFGNIQKPSHPCLMDFDLKNKSNWDPRFASSRHDLTSVQPTEFTYTAVNEDILVELLSNLEREIKLTFDETRKHAIPQWNLMASRVLREILNEDSTGSGYDFDIEHRLCQTLSSYSVTVVAFRSPNISRQKLIDEVLKTNMHINSNKMPNLLKAFIFNNL